MTGNLSILGDLSNLTWYPTKDTCSQVQECFKNLTESYPEAAEYLFPLKEFTEKNETSSLEELFTMTFDVNPVTALEVGWHLYGETYERGAFLVKMRELIMEFGLNEDKELPDYLGSVIRVYEKSPERSWIGDRVILPALEKMIAGFEEKNNPYLGLLLAIQNVVKVEQEDQKRGHV